MKKLLCLIITLLLLSLTVFLSSAEDSSSNYTLRCENGEYILFLDDGEIMRERSILPIISMPEIESIYFDNVRIFEDMSFEDRKLRLSGSIFCDGGADIYIGEAASVELSELCVNMLSNDNVICVGGGELFILNDSEIISDGYDILTDVPIIFMSEGERYTGSDVFKLKYTGEGSSIFDIAVFEDREPPIELYSERDERISIHKLTYISEYSESSSVYMLHGEPLELPDSPEVVGYDYLGWYTDGAPAEEGTPVTSSLTLYAEYRLIPPNVKISDIGFMYDGAVHYIDAETLTHPLSDEGEFSYKWYKDGVLVSEEPRLPLCNRVDSGEYTLEVVFSHGENTSASITCKTAVTISPITLKLEYKDDGFVIVSGEPIDGDSVDIREIKEGGALYAETSNSNYCLEFSPQNLKNSNMDAWVLAWILILLAVLCAIVYFVFWSAETDAQIASARHFSQPFCEDPYVRTRGEDSDLREFFFGIDRFKADELLSDELAKNMIIKGGRTLTYGRGTAEISLGVINEKFYAGELVDIHELKKRGIVSENTATLKITADGVVDKPLKIAADSFDIAAVKMITLSGGEAIRIKSRRR